MQKAWLGEARDHGWQECGRYRKAMSSNTVRISLSDIAAAGVLLSHSDAVTIACEAALRAERGVLSGIPAPDDLRLSSDGDIEALGTPARGNEIRRAARLLAALLAHAEQDVASPATFRLILARAFADDEAAYESLDQFVVALVPFAAEDASAVVRDVVGRWRAKMAAAGGSLDDFASEPASIAPAAVPAAAAAAVIAPEPKSDEYPLAHPDPLPAEVPMVLAADKDESVAGEESVPIDKPVPVVVASEPEPLRIRAGDTSIPAETRRDLTAPATRSVERRSYLRGWISLAAAAALLGAMVPALWSFSRSRSTPAAVEEQATSSKPENPPKAGEPQKPAGPQTGTSPSEKVEQEPTAARSQPLAPGEKRPSTSPPPPQASSVATSGGAPSNAAPKEVIREAAYSPSFASAASAMFYHSGTGPGSAIMRADTDDSGMVLRVTSVVNDRGSNFHPRPSPDGQLLAFDSDRDGERGVYVADSNGRDVRRVSGPGFAAVPSWSPDGRRLAFVKAEDGKPRVWNIWMVDMSTGKATRITSYRVGQPWGAAWFPDGDRIAYSHEDRLIVRSVPGKDVRIFKSPIRGRLIRTPAVSPDGKRIIFQVRRDGAWMLDVPSGSMSRVLEDPSAEEFTWSPDGKRVAYHSRRSGAWGVWMMAPRE